MCQDTIDILRQPSAESFSWPFWSQKRFVLPSEIDILVCIPLPLTPTTGLGRKACGIAHVSRDLPAQQLIELDLVGRGYHLAIAVINLELAGRNFRVIFLIAKAHRSL